MALTGCGGDSARQVKIVSDLPIHGSDSEQSTQMVWAIEYVIRKYGGEAGKFKIQFESMDNSAAGKWDAAKCVDHAHSYASDEAIVGVIGTANSGCSAYEIPILNKAHLAMVSPADTAVALTKHERYYPLEKGDPFRKRSFFRVVPSDDHQGRAGVAFMKSLSVTRVYVLDDGGLYGEGVAAAFRRSAKNEGLKVVGRAGWGNWDNKGAKTYAALITKIKKKGADGIYLGGGTSPSSRRLIKKILRNIEGVKLLVSDGLLSSPIAAAGGRREKLFGTFPAASATAPGKQLKRKLKQAEPDTRFAPYTLHAAAAAEVLLDAICRSNGSRDDVIAKLLGTHLDTAVGPVAFGKGDRKHAGTTGYEVYQAKKGVWRRVAVYRAKKGVWRPVSGRKDDVRKPVRAGCLKPGGRHPDKGSRSNP